MSEKSSKDTSETTSTIKISSSVLQRLESGVSDDQKTTATDDFWIDKLASVNTEHTRTSGLDTQEVEKLFRNLSRYATPKTDKNCPVDTAKAANCLKENKGNTLACAGEVKTFTQCVDKSLYEAVRKDWKDIRPSKKESYTETFERQYHL